MTTYKSNASNLYKWLAVAVFVTAIPSYAASTAPATFKAKCAGCHGADGSGDTAMGKKFKLRDLRAADVQKGSDESLHEIIAKGKPPMPAFGKTLDAASVTDLVAYIRSIAAK